MNEGALVTERFGRSRIKKTDRRTGRQKWFWLSEGVNARTQAKHCKLLVQCGAATTELSALDREVGRPDVNCRDLLV